MFAWVHFIVDVTMVVMLILFLRQNDLLRKRLSSIEIELKSMWSLFRIFADLLPDSKSSSETKR